MKTKNECRNSSASPRPHSENSKIQIVRTLIHLIDLINIIKILIMKIMLIKKIRVQTPAQSESPPTLEVFPPLLFGALQQFLPMRITQHIFPFV